MVDINFADNKKIIEYQNIQLKDTLYYLSKYSPYYKRLFKENNIDDLDSITINNINKIPITKKKDLTDYNYEFFCNDISEAADIVSTSGSTSKVPIIHPLTKSDLVRLAYNERVSFQKADLQKNDMVLLTTALDGSFVAGLAYYMGIKEIGSKIIRTGSRNIILQYNVLKTYPINVIIGVPSNIIRLYEFCKEKDLDLSDRDITKLILIGEAIKDKDFQLNQLGIRLSKCFPKAKLFSTYANTETCTSFCECKFGMGGHLNPDLAYAEIMGSDDNILPDGQMGRLIITTFGAEGMPLLRYDTGDITFINRSKCRCGRTSLRIGPILGRSEGICKINGITFNISSLGDVILKITELLDYCIVVKKDDNGVAYLCVYYTSMYESKDINEKLKQSIWKAIRVKARVNYCSFHELQKIQHSSGSRKPVRYQNELL